MALQIEFLETSFQAIALCGEVFMIAFYERLFTQFPRRVSAQIKCQHSACEALRDDFSSWFLPHNVVLGPVW